MILLSYLYPVFVGGTFVHPGRVFRSQPVLELWRSWRGGEGADGRLPEGDSPKREHPKHRRHAGISRTASTTSVLNMPPCALRKAGRQANCSTRVCSERLTGLFSLPRHLPLTAVLSNGVSLRSSMRTLRMVSECRAGVCILPECGREPVVDIIELVARHAYFVAMHDPLCAAYAAVHYDLQVRQCVTWFSLKSNQLNLAPALSTMLVHVAGILHFGRSL